MGEDGGLTECLLYYYYFINNASLAFIPHGLSIAVMSPVYLPEIPLLILLSAVSLLSFTI